MTGTFFVVTPVKSCVRWVGNLILIAERYLLEIVVQAS